LKSETENKCDKHRNMAIKRIMPEYIEQDEDYMKKINKYEKTLLNPFVK
jgi:hypothetical protein